MASAQAAGPWLVALDQAPEASARLIALPAPKPAMTVWCCAGEMVLYRHLRTLSMARIPDWAADGRAAPANPAAAPVYETVFFRHWDPRVLGALLPCLDAAQFSRILGPAAEIAFVAPDFGGLRRVVTDPDWPVAPPGLLTLRGDQCQAMIARRIAASCRRIAAYLRRYAPLHTSGLDDDALLGNVERYEGEARASGVRNENAVALWSYMQTTSRSDLSRDGPVLRFICDPACGATPDAHMEALFDLRTRLIKEVYG